MLIEDEDPIPMYAQKLLVMLLDHRCIQIENILQLKLISQFFEFLQADLNSINLHNVRLCLYLSSSPIVDSKVLSDLRVVRHVGALLDFVHAKGMQDFLDPVLSVCRCLLVRSVGDATETTGRDFTWPGMLRLRPYLIESYCYVHFQYPTIGCIVSQL